MSTPPVLDGGLGWVAVAAGFINSFLCMGFCRSGGIIYVESVHKFHGSRSVASWIPMVAVAAIFFTAPIGTALCKKYSYSSVIFVGGLLTSLGMLVCFLATGIEHFFIGWGLMFGFGSSLAFFPVVAFIGQCFKKKFTLANGIVVTGGALGAFCLPPLLEFLIESYGLRGAMLITCAIMFHCGFASFLLHLVLRRTTMMNKCKLQRLVIEETEMQLLGKETTVEAQFLAQNDRVGGDGIHQQTRTETKNDNEGAYPIGSCFETGKWCRNILSQSFKYLVDTIDLAVICNHTFIINCASHGTQTALLFCLCVLLPDFGEDELKVPRIDASYLVSGCAIADMASRLLFGWIFTRFKHRQNVTYFWVLLAFASSFLIISLTLQYEVVMLGSVVAGTCYACGIMLYVDILKSCQSTDKFPMALGFSEFMKAPLILFSASTVGTLKDATGSYFTTLFIFCGLGIFASSLWILEHFLSRRKSKKPITTISI